MTTTTDGTATYSYDNTNQVTGASYTGTGQPSNESYSYDSNGNRTNTGYSTGTNNQLLSDGTFNYVYDAEGNRISRTRISNASANDYKTTYTWDYRDRLTDVDFYNNSNVLTKHVHYTYDAFDHLISKSVDSTGSGSYDREEYFVYDGNSIVLDFVDPDGAGPQPVALATRYLNGPSNSELTDQVFAQEDASTGNILWLLSDNLSTTRDVVNDSSAIVAHEVYNSFGQLASGPTNVTHYLYTGQMWDADVGLQYNWHRWYDPAVGRWISRDPIVFTAGDANLNRYVGNEVTVNLDPTGEFKLFGQNWVTPWDPNAAGFTETIQAYGKAAAVAAAGTASGAVTGAATGAVTGAAVGAVGGAIAGAGVGAGPGALAGASAGAVSGGIWGGLTGLCHAAFADTAGEAALSGAKGGAFAGVGAGGFAAAGKITQLAVDAGVLPLYHYTTAAAKASIEACGVIKAPVYATVIPPSIMTMPIIGTIPKLGIGWLGSFQIANFAYKPLTQWIVIPSATPFTQTIFSFWIFVSKTVPVPPV